MTKFFTISNPKVWYSIGVFAVVFGLLNKIGDYHFILTVLYTIIGFLCVGVGVILQVLTGTLEVKVNFQDFNEIADQQYKYLDELFEYDSIAKQDLYVRITEGIKDIKDEPWYSEQVIYAEDGDFIPYIRYHEYINE